MGEDIYEDISYLENDFQLAESFYKNVVARSTNGNYDSENYKIIRTKFLQDNTLKALLPDYIKSNRDIEQFWQFIKVQFSGTGSYEARRKFLHESFQELLNYLEEICILADKKSVKLYHKDKVITIDEELDALIYESKERFENPKDKQVALEKLWDAFERIKTHFGTNKRESSSTLVDMISSDFDRDFIEKEFKELTTIGNTYRIRHHEQGKIEIKDIRHIEYLFLRMLALLNLCLENIKVEDKDKRLF